ncbi:hypothetical protein P170DRAFT_378960 [Aspergillus steynii IBT 23096]|uniref:Uncharacterized protein n=1 Tax=Aspergillus steynii IBT 23096 TaxID=1392250 RepID=A0A2I2GIU0_9EURO|nr:uncharacterized protein P170DRAFT_378960 [Aspergillus steynii IBT 23096]PLB52805.1 hypothetical protein P170DRAFT_378960 [Aspergillus steynii IBT 23096]
MSRYPFSRTIKRLRLKDASGTNPTRNVFSPKKAWRPTPLRTPFLLSLAGLMLVTLVTLEVLRCHSNRNEGIVFYNDLTDVNNTMLAGSKYVPTLVALIIVTLWSFCAYDVMRLEPFLQLAKHEGVPATVLLINYNFSYGILAPINAARNNHWIVFCVSIMSLALRMFLPALCSGLMILNDVDLHNTQTANIWPDVIDGESQAAWMSGQMPRRGHSAMSAMNAHMPLLRSSEYAMAPFVMPVDDQNEDSMLYLNQTVYWADVTCADIPLDQLPPGSASFENSTSDGRQTVSLTAHGARPSWRDARDVTKNGCIIDIALDSTIPNNTDSFQVRYWEPHQKNSTSKVFNARQCDQYDLYGIIVDLQVGGKGSISTTKAAAFGCTATYENANANVSITANSSIDSVTIYPNTVNRLDMSEFRADKFQDLMYRISDGVMVERGQVGSQAVPHRATVITDPAQYQSEVVDLWKRTYVFTMNQLFDPTTGSIALDAVQVTPGASIMMISHTALVAESLLGSASLLLLYLAYVYPRRASFLRSDPGSLAAQLRIIADLFHPDTAVALSDANLHKATTRQLRGWASNLQCQWREGPHGWRIEFAPIHGRSSTISARAARRQQDPVPHFLMLPCFAIECLLLIVMLVVFSLSLKRFGFHDDNPAYYSNWDFMCLLLLLYAPNVIASMITALLASSLRHLSILEPWVQLERGMATAKQTLLMNYSSRTPLAVFAKCAKKGPPILTIVSLACVIDLILSLISGSIFLAQTNTYVDPTSVLSQQYSLSKFSTSESAPEFDSFHFIPMRKSMPLVPWTTSDYSFYPVAINDSEWMRSFYTTTTRGIGADLTCRVLHANRLQTEANTGKQYWYYEPFDHSDSAHCTVEVPQVAEIDNTPLDDNSIRYLTSLESGSCQTKTIVVIARWNLFNGTVGDPENTLALHCEPQISIQDFEIDFNFNGQVQARRPVTGSTITSGGVFLNATKSLGRYNHALAQFVQRTAAHRASSFSYFDWPGVLTAHAYEEVDPDFSSFDADILMNATQSVYSTIFSTYFSLWRDLYIDRLTESPLPVLKGTQTQLYWEMVLSIPTMVIVIVIVSIDVMVMAGVFFTRRGRFHGPRIPRSIGALMPWVTHSQMMRDSNEASRLDRSEWEEFLQEDWRRYRFGESACPDEVTRWTLDYDPKAEKEEHEMQAKEPHVECAPVAEPEPTERGTDQPLRG